MALELGKSRAGALSAGVGALPLTMKPAPITRDGMTQRRCALGVSCCYFFSR
jgi:hypothetical protein